MHPCFQGLVQPRFSLICGESLEHEPTYIPVLSLILSDPIEVLSLIIDT